MEEAEIERLILYRMKIICKSHIPLLQGNYMKHLYFKSCFVCPYLLDTLAICIDEVYKHCPLMNLTKQMGLILFLVVDHRMIQDNYYLYFYF